jgi:hypothetical protein
MLNSTLSFQFPISTAEASAASRSPGCRRWRRWRRWRRCYGTKVGAAHAGAAVNSAGHAGPKDWADRRERFLLKEGLL